MDGKLPGGTLPVTQPGKRGEDRPIRCVCACVLTCSVLCWACVFMCVHLYYVCVVLCMRVHAYVCIVHARALCACVLCMCVHMYMHVICIVCACLGMCALRMHVGSGSEEKAQMKWGRHPVSDTLSTHACAPSVRKGGSRYLRSCPHHLSTCVDDRALHFPLMHTSKASSC